MEIASKINLYTAISPSRLSGREKSRDKKFSTVVNIEFVSCYRLVWAGHKQ